MNMDIGEVITLGDDKDYAITHKKEINGIQYALLIEMPKYESFKFVKFLDGENLEIVEDSELIEQLLVEFNKADK